MSTTIESLGVYLPPRQVSTDEILRGCRMKIRFPLERMTGIRFRHVAGDGEFAFDLAKHAVTRCLATSRYAPADVDLVISAAVGRIDAPPFVVAYEPSTAVRLKHHFGFDRAMAFDISSACSGMWVGISIAHTLLSQQLIGRALIVSGEYISNLGTTAQLEIEDLLDPRLACLTLGDAGAAVLLDAGARSSAGFAAIDLQTLGEYAGCCMAGPTEQAHGGGIMHTDALRLTDAAARHGGEHALETLRQAGWDCDDFQHLIMHQTSRTALTSATRAINRLLKRPVCHAGNTIDNLEQRGNTASTTHFVALADAIASRRIRSGDRVIFAISGSGLTLGTALYTFDDLPDRLVEAPPPAASLTRANGGRTNVTSPRAGSRIRVASVGIVPRSAGGSRRDTVALLTCAATDCLNRSQYAASDIGLFIYAGTYRSRFLTEPALAALLAGSLGVQRTLAFDVFNGGVAIVNACHVATQMIRAGKVARAMVVASEIENNAEAFPTDMLGIEETGSALLLEAASGRDEGFGSFMLRSFAEHEGDFVSHLMNRDEKAYLRFTKAPDLERHYIDAMARTTSEYFRSEDVALADIDWVLAPQVSSAFLTELSGVLGLPRERFIDVQAGKDLFTSSIPVALHAAREGGLVQAGDSGLIVTAGSGIQVGCVLYHF